MINKPLIGQAGVYHVAAELSLRGMVATVTTRNTAGADILVADPDGKRFAFLQVKTSKSKVTFWPVGDTCRTWTGEHCYYVFVRRVKDAWEVFLEKAAVVAQESEANDQAAIKRGNKKWAPWWALTGQDASAGAEERTRRQWEEFNL